MKNTEHIVSLIADIQSGKESAAAALYEAYHQDVYYYILKTVKDPELAADLTQDTFIEILQTIGNLEEPAAFPAWSRQIAYHKCTAHFRKRHDVLADENEEGQTVFDTMVEDREEFIPDEALEKQDLRQTIHAMIDSLPEEQRTAIMMRYFDELSVKEIAQVQGVSEGTVKSRLNYGRQSIKQSVKDYEKKNGVKLHCAGVIPLLLWLLKMTGGLDKSASAATVAKEGLRTAGKLTAKKVIAGAAAAAVVTGGVTAGVLLSKEPEVQFDEPAPLMQWYGYGEIAGYDGKRFDLRIEDMDDTHITGDLEVTALYETEHKTHFEGEGVASEDFVIYTLNFETPLVLYDTYPQLELKYDKQTDQFIFDEWYVYEATLNRAKAEPSMLLAQNEVWSGYGVDGFYNGLYGDHLFILEISELRAEAIKGKLTVSYEGQTDHITEFTGRGYTENGKIYCEVLLETPRTMDYIIEYTLDSFWLTYDTQTEIFRTSALGCMYEFEIGKINSKK